VTSGTGRRADIGRPQAGKTGTATNYRDVWYVGFVPQLTTSVWVGYADRQDPLEDFTVWNDLEGAEQYYRRAFGSTLPAPIWRQFMQYALAGQPALDFPEDPPGTDVYRQTPFATVPALAPSTSEAVEAVFRAGLYGEVAEVPSTLPAGTLVGTVPLPGTPIRQGSTVLIQVSSGIAPEVTMIDLRGLTPALVNERLAEFSDEQGLAVTWSFVDIVTTNPAQHGRVVTSMPAPGAPIGQNQAIEVRIGRAP
jgi:hypothetical protein